MAEWFVVVYDFEGEAIVSKTRVEFGNELARVYEAPSYREALAGLCTAEASGAAGCEVLDFEGRVVLSIGDWPQTCDVPALAGHYERDRHTQIWRPLATAAGEGG